MDVSYNGEFKNDFKVASFFGDAVMDILNERLDNKEFVHTENLRETVAELLDHYSGIDGLMKSDGDLSGVALRIQKHSSKNWGTFTIRYSRHTGTKTEYSKRKREIYNIANDVFYPHYTCQVYFDNNDRFLGGAFCLTKDLFDIAIKFEPFNKTGNPVYLQTNRGDNNTFIVVPFELFDENKILRL